MKILCVSTGPWAYQGRHQHLMSLLADNQRVFYVEAGGNIVHRLRDSNKWPWHRTLEVPDKNLTIFSPWPTLPGKNSVAVINEISQVWVREQICREITKRDFDPDVLWVNRPNFLPHIGRYGEKISVYDCADDFELLGNWFRPKLVREMERKLLNCVDAAFFSAGKLLEKNEKLASRTALIRNAADYTHFSEAECSERGKLAPSDTPIIGFYGGLGHWIDWELLLAIAESYQSCQLVLIGPGADKLPQILVNKRNVTCLGEIPYERLPALGACFDVCLVPFLTNDLTRAVDPIKVYEYLAMGKPVVSTKLPELKRCDQLVYQAESGDEFLEKIAVALQERAVESEKVVRRKKYARCHSWEARKEAVEQELAAMLGQYTQRTEREV